MKEIERNEMDGYVRYHTIPEIRWRIKRVLIRPVGYPKPVELPLCSSEVIPFEAENIVQARERALDQLILMADDRGLIEQIDVELVEDNGDGTTKTRVVG